MKLAFASICFGARYSSAGNASASSKAPMLRPALAASRSLTIKAETTARSMQLRNSPKIGSLIESSSYLAVMLSAHFCARGLALPLCVRPPWASTKSSSLMAFTPRPRSRQARPFIGQQRLVVGRQPPTWQHVLRSGLALALEHVQIARQALDGRRIEVHAQPFHAKVGGQQHAREVAEGRHALDGDDLRSQQALERLRRRFGSRAESAGLLRLLQPGQAFLGR